MAKTGRKQADFRDPETNKLIVGLSRMTDLRWRIIGTQIRFTEPDIQKAIRRFYQIKGIKKFEGQGFSPEEIAWLNTPAEVIAKTNMVSAVINGFVEIGEHEEAEKKHWAWVAKQIAERPKWVAKMTGIEWIAWHKHEMPAPALKVDAISNAWKTHAKVTDKTKVLSAWEDFTETMSIETIDDITEETTVEYRDDVYERIVTPRGKEAGPISPKEQQHIFSNIRRILRFAKERAIGIKPISGALDILEILKPNDSTITRDPHPISVADWKAIYGKAQGEKKALVLLCLNGAFYLREVIRLTWEDIRPDGTIITHRKKRGQIIRVCCLWKETLEALNALERKNHYIFLNYLKEPLGISGAQKWFNDLAELAGCPDVTGSHLRDGAITAAVQAGVPEDKTKILAGHKGSGKSDSYVLRDPTMVAPACSAIYAKYFGA